MSKAVITKVDAFDPKFFNINSIENMKEGFTFDDVLLIPGKQGVKSRSTVNLAPPKTKLKVLVKHPFISSPMDTISGAEMLKAMRHSGGFGIFHRYGTGDTLVKDLKAVSSLFGVWVSCGLNRQCSFTDNYAYEEVIDLLRYFNIEGVNIDVANGYSDKVAKTIENIKKESDLQVIVGNVATAEGFKFLEDAGADGIRVGIGNGSICSTRLQTGVGVPQLTALMNCNQVRKEAAIICDGGIKKPGDAAKAIAAGADYIISGRMFAGCKEAIKQDKYRGMASFEAQRNNGGLRKGTIPEGVQIEITSEPKEVQDIIDEYCGGLRSAVSYCGASNLVEFKQNAKFIRVTAASLEESKTHGIS